MSSIDGKTLLITRPAGQYEDFARLFRERGAKVLSHPVIEIVPPVNWSQVDRAIGNLPSFDWLIFTSANGVRYFFARLHQLHPNRQIFTGVRFAVVGQQTALELAKHGFEAQLLPEPFDGASLAAELVQKKQNREPIRCLSLRADRANPELGEILKSAGIPLEEVVVYRSIDVEKADPEIVRLMEQGKIDWVTVTSVAIARAAVNLFGQHLKNCQLLSISPKTTAALNDLGFFPAAEAKQADRYSLLEAMEQF